MKKNEIMIFVPNQIVVYTGGLWRRDANGKQFVDNTLIYCKVIKRYHEDSLKRWCVIGIREKNPHIEGDNPIFRYIFESKFENIIPIFEEVEC